MLDTVRLNMGSGSFDWLQRWYRAHTDGDWEHQHGIKIETIDNPGWRVDVDLSETELERSSFSRVEVERSDSDWIHCWVEDGKFKIACGLSNLDEALSVFQSWAEAAHDQTYPHGT